MTSNPLVFGDPSSEAAAAASRLSSGIFILTTAHEGKRAGVVVRSAMICANNPLLVCVAAFKGLGLEPLIRDSRRFAVLQVDPEDRFVVRKFSGHINDNGDQFDALPVETLTTGAPIIKRSIVALDCEVVRHWDIEADHELYVGVVRAGRIYGYRPAPAMQSQMQNNQQMPRAAS